MNRFVRATRSFVAILAAASAVACGGNPADANDSFSIDSSAQSLYDDVPDRELQATIRRDSKHPNLGFKRARAYIFEKIDNKDGKVRDVYTGRVVSTRSVPSGDDMNIEHTWPQSRLPGGAAVADMHHLYPCDAYANMKRGNNEFGVVSKVEWQKNDAKLGDDPDGDNVFEPPPDHRGNAARSLFYMSVVYNLRIHAEEETVLRKWHDQDPVDQAERDREAAIASIQKNRNPFIVDDRLVDRIADF